jgi:26S proteasome regulatory subunit N8
MAETARSTAGEGEGAASTGPSPPIHSKVVVHPIVLLSVVDHYNRIAKDTKKRVVGMLLGSSSKGVVDVTNCYAVPFEEDERDLKIWYLDHSFHEQMFAMFKKVNASEKLVGWYTTGPKIKPGDLQIDALVRRYTPNPVMVIIDVKPKLLGIPTEAYHAVEEIREGAQQTWTFKHVPSEISASESEEVGVEHLLRDVKDMTISTLANRVTQKLGALKGLAARLLEVNTYLENVLAGKTPVNHQIIYRLQDIFNLLPNLNVEELVKAFAVKTNDMMLAIYLSSIIRAVIALHNLVDNRLINKDKERASDEASKKDSDAKKDDAKKDDKKEDAKKDDAKKK